MSQSEQDRGVRRSVTKANSIKLPPPPKERKKALKKRSETAEVHMSQIEKDFRDFDHDEEIRKRAKLQSDIEAIKERAKTVTFKKKEDPTKAA